MKGLRTFIALLVVAAALGAFLYYDSKREPATDTKQEKVFADVQADKIDEVTVKSASGTQTTLRKQAAGWQITAPETVPADEAEISGITTNLASLEAQRVIDDQPSNVKEYGLDPARIE